MNGTHLTLGLVGLAALAGVGRRGSRAVAQAPAKLERVAPGLGALRAAMVAVAAEDTAYGQGYAGRGDLLALHCGAVSHVVQRRYGGRVLSGRVRGEPHLWNRLPDGTEVDLSGSQYGGDGWHPLVKGRVEPVRKTVNPRFARFEERVHEALGKRGSRSVTLSLSRRGDFDALADDFRSWSREWASGDRNLVDDDLEAFAAENDLEFLGSGAARAVFRVPEGALKIEYGWPPFTDNALEAKVWASAPAALARHLVPVLAHAYNHGWLLMTEVEVGGEVSPEGREVLDACGLGDFLFHYANVSKDGRLVDYAFVVDGGGLGECLTRGREQRKGSLSIFDCKAEEIRGRIEKYRKMLARQEDEDLRDLISSLETKLEEVQGLASRARSLDGDEGRAFALRCAEKLVALIQKEAGAPKHVKVWSRPGVGVRVYLPSDQYLSVGMDGSVSELGAPGGKASFLWSSFYRPQRQALRSALVKYREWLRGALDLRSSGPP